MSRIAPIAIEEKLRAYLPDIDFGVLSHGFTSYMRDYLLVVQVGGRGETSGTHECLFTHCVAANLETRVRDDVWPISWEDTFIDYEAWRTSGQPSGYVWGTEWSLAYPGLLYVANSTLAAHWTERLGKPMHEVTLETEAYFLQLIFHDVRFRLVNKETAPTSAVLIPLPPRSDA